MEYSVSLPNELWNEVASYLEPKDQAFLSQTNKQLAHITNRLLYKEPKIKRPDNGTRLMSLLGTLLEHPQRLEGMKSLTIAVTNRRVPTIKEQKNGGRSEIRRLGPGGLDTRLRSPQYQAIRQQLKDRLEERGITQESHPAWLGSIQSWSVPAFFGALLVLLPSLKHLGVTCFEEEQNKNFHPSKGGFTEMLFSKKGLAPANYDFLQHLKIDSLDFSGQFTSLFLNLPHLKHLRLGLRTRLELTPNIKSNLTHVEMHIAVKEVYIQYGVYPDLKILLAPSVKHITAHLILPTEEGLKRDCLTNESPLFQNLLEDLHQMVPDLETLELKPEFEWENSGEMPEIAGQFTKMEKLTINDIKMLK